MNREAEYTDRVSINHQATIEKIILKLTYNILFFQDKANPITNKNSKVTVFIG